MKTDIFCDFMAGNYWFVIRVDDKEVWRGKEPRERLFELKKKYPNSKVSIAWESNDDLLIPWFDFV